MPGKRCCAHLCHDIHTSSSDDSKGRCNGPHCGIRFAGQVPEKESTDETFHRQRLAVRCKPTQYVSQRHRNNQFVARMAIPLKGYVLNVYAWSSMRQSGSRTDRTSCKITGCDSTIRSYSSPKPSYRVLSRTGDEKMRARSRLPLVALTKPALFINASAAITDPLLRRASG